MRNEDLVALIRTQSEEDPERRFFEHMEEENFKPNKVKTNGD